MRDISPRTFKDHGYHSALIILVISLAASCIFVLTMMSIAMFYYPDLVGTWGTIAITAIPTLGGVIGGLLATMRSKSSRGM